MSPMLRSQFCATKQGTKVHFLHTPESTGPSVVCLHGLGGSVRTFSRLIKVIPTTYNIIAIDFPGFGKTPLNPTKQKLDISGHVADVHDVITHVQGVSSGVEEKERVIFIGHSLGSIVALHYASVYPEKVAGLALLGVGRSAAHIPAVQQRMLDVAAETRKNGIDGTAFKSAAGNFPTSEQRETPPNHIEEVQTAVSQSDPEGYARTCEMIVSLSHVDPDYGKIRCPTVLIAGDMDAISPMQRSKDVSTLLGGESWVEVVRSGHQPLISDFDASHSAILTLFEKTRTSA